LPDGLALLDEGMHPSGESCDVSAATSAHNFGACAAIAEVRGSTYNMFERNR
jgi:hypothetical protein